jgi:uncharacterized protein (DUF433 family)
MPQLYIVLASLAVAVVFHWIRYGGQAMVARFRQFPARLLNLILAGIAAVILVHSFNLGLIVVDAALVYCASSMAESLWNEIQIRRGKLA